MDDLDSGYQQTRVECMEDRLDVEIRNYQHTLKIYKRLDKLVSIAQGACSVASLMLTSYTMGSALTGIGAIASLPLGSLACLSATGVMVLTLISRRIMKKKKKHRDTLRLVQSTKSLVEQCISTAFADDEQINDAEFGNITTCLKNYYDKKDKL